MTNEMTEDERRNYWSHAKWDEYERCVACRAQKHWAEEQMCTVVVRSRTEAQ